MTDNSTRRTRQSDRAGSAMILVVLILGVLVVISFPFLTSMVRHANNARSYQAETQSNQVADLSTQSASGILVNGEVNREWQRRERVSPDPTSRKALGKWPFITPYMDYTVEVRTVRRHLAKYFLELDGLQSRGSRSALGIQIEDEQGKLNLTTAPDRVLNNLKSMMGPSERIEQYVTRHSVRPTSRIVSPSNQPSPNTNVQSGDIINWTSTRHPINVNTAHWKVIAANLVDLGEWKGEDEQPEETIGITISDADEFDQSTSKNIARFIKSKTPINGWYQFEDVLEDADDEDLISGTQKAVILKNARKGSILFKNINVNRNSSMPFCFRSYDRYTVQSRSTTLDRAGNPMSDAGARTVISTTPGQSSHLLKSPYEFSESLSQLRRSQGISRNNGHGFILGPRKIFRQQKQKRSESFDDNEMGTWSGTRILKDRDTEAYIQPRPNDRGKYSPYGKEVKAEGIEKKNLVSTGSGYKPHSTAPGGVKFWVKFNGSPSATSLVDVAKSTYQSRIHLYYQDGKLLLDAADPTLEKKYTRIETNWNPQSDTWYHVGAFWKSTKYGHLALMIDGHLVGEMKMVNENDENLLQPISGALSKEAPASQLSSLEPGYWELGEEIIKISGRTEDTTSGNNRQGQNRGLGRQLTTPHKHGQNSVASPYGFSIQLADTTGFVNMSTNLYPHVDQQVRLKANLSGIPNFKIRTTSAFGDSVRPTICPETYQEEQDGRVECVPPEEEENDDWQLGESTGSIPVVANGNDDLSDLPSPALLLIYGTVSTGDSNGQNGSNNGGQNEEAKYEVVVCNDASNNELSNCSRGALDTEQVNWQAGANVALLGFPVDNADGFPTKNDQGRIVQVDTEWIGPVKPHNVDGTTFLGSTDKKIPLLREVQGTSLGSEEIHEPDRKVLPVFSLEEEEPEERVLPDGLTMLRDVTLAYKPEDQLKKQRVTIRLSKASTYNSLSSAALDDFVPEHVKAEGVNRLLKFPSGELMAQSSVAGDDEESKATAYLGTSSPNAEQIGSMSGWIANYESVNGPRSHRILDEPIDDASSEVIVRGNQLDSPGALKVGDELIGFPETEPSQRLPIDEEQRPEDKTTEEIIEENDRFSRRDLLPLTELSEVTRGYLEATKNPHNRGDRVFVLSKGMIDVSALSDPLNPEEATVNVKNSSLSSSGYEYYRIDDEILGLKGGSMPRHSDTNRGLFRGAFGTTPSAHPENTMVFRTPHRYPHRVPKNMTHHLYKDMQFHVVSANRPDAVWTGLSWEVDRDEQQGSLPRLLVRIDEGTDWHKVQKRYTLTSGSSIEFNEVTDRLELLFLFDYEDGAYSATNWRSQHGWKTTSRLRQVKMKYRLPSRTFLHRQIK